MSSQSFTRRNVIKTGAAIAAAGSGPRPLMALLHRRPEPIPPISDPSVKRLTDAALNAARSAGVTYADARLTHTFEKGFGFKLPMEMESMTFGVRVLVDGYWGFASSPIWTPDEAVRLTTAAVRNARANTLGTPRTLELAPVASVSNGHWETPVKDDAFKIDRAEIEDFLHGIAMFMNRLPNVSPQSPSASFFKQEKAYASTADQYCTQTLYRSEADIAFLLRIPAQGEIGAKLDTLTPASAGFEYIRGQPIREQILQLVEECKQDLSIPAKPVDVGRYPLVLDALSVARIVSQTIGNATQLDRALGFEANAGGTSYIKEPLDMVGSFKVGASNISISANRSEPMGAATVKWDDEGVSPNAFTLVKDGILVDMQTNREGGAWLKDYYAKRQQPVVSNGCASAPMAIYAPMTHTANLNLKPGDAGATFESLIAAQEKGVAVKRAATDMDFQQITGFTTGAMYEIKHGKRVARLNAAGVVFRTPELWSAITTLGGPESRRQYGLDAAKGQPAQTMYHSVTSVPVATKELTVIDISRKA